MFCFCCAVVSHTRVDRKPSDLNHAELPRLEGTVTLLSHGSQSVCNIFSRKNRQSSILLPILSPSPLPVTQLEPIPLFFHCVRPYMDKLNFTKCDGNCHARSQGKCGTLVPGMDSAIVQRERTSRGRYFFDIRSSTIKIHYANI